MIRANVVSKILTAVFLVSVVAQTGCLQTRSTMKEAEEKQVLRKQVTSLQQNTADQSARFSEIDEDLRKSSGRIESLDARVSQIKERAEKNDFALEAKIKEQDAKFLAFREELTKLQSELAEVKAANQALQSSLAAGGGAFGGSSNSRASGDSKNPFETGESRFEQKNWREAIFAYEDYRKTYPKGKSFGAATYKIGVCFQELGMNDDAKPFYEEVIAKFPKSKEADRSRARLKTLGKKR